MGEERESEEEEANFKEDIMREESQSEKDLKARIPMRKFREYSALEK